MRRLLVERPELAAPGQDVLEHEIDVEADLAARAHVRRDLEGQADRLALDQRGRAARGAGQAGRAADERDDLAAGEQRLHVIGGGDVRRGQDLDLVALGQGLEQHGERRDAGAEQLGDAGQRQADDAAQEAVHAGARLAGRSEVDERRQLRMAQRAQPQPVAGEMSGMPGRANRARPAGSDLDDERLDEDLRPRGVELAQDLLQRQVVAVRAEHQQRVAERVGGDAHVSLDGDRVVRRRRRGRRCGRPAVPTGSPARVLLSRPRPARAGPGRGTLPEQRAQRLGHLLGARVLEEVDVHPPAPRALDVDVEPLDQGARPLVGRATGQQDERVRALVGHDAGRRLGGRSTGRLASRGRPGAPRRTRSRRRRRRRPGRVGRSGSDVRRFEKRAQGLDQLGRRGVANRQEIQALVGPGPVNLVEHLAHRRDVAAVVGHHDDAGPWQIHDLAGGRGERGERLRQVATGHLRRPEDDAHQLFASRRPRGRAEQRQRLPLGCRRLHDLEEVTSRHHGQVQALQGDEEEAPGLARLHRPRRHHRHRELPRRHRPGEDEVLAGEAHRPPGQLLQLHPGPQAHGHRPARLPAPVERVVLARDRLG